jgi:HK97 gp10 family phage protein
MIDIRVIGDKALQRKLKGLEDKMQKKIVRKALREGGKIVLREAKNRAPKDTGSLRASLKLRSLKRSKKRIGVQIVTDEAALMKAKDRKAGRKVKRSTNADRLLFYAAFVELGTRNMPARPFLRPALKSKKAEVIGRARAVMRREVKAAVK